jgi:hypothetical protein
MDLPGELLAAYDEAMAVVEEIRASEEPWPDDGAVTHLREAGSRVAERWTEAMERMRSGGPRANCSELLDIAHELSRLSGILWDCYCCKSEYFAIVEIEPKPTGLEHDIAVSALADVSARRAKLQEEFRQDRKGQRS